MPNERDPLLTTHDRKHLSEVLQGFSTMMLGTYEHTGQQPALRGRPMHVARVDADGTLWFLTRDPSEKLDEAAQTRVAHVFAQSDKQFISMQGEISISTDRAVIRELWKASYGVWLDGPEDPHAVLLVFAPHDAELWDMSGMKGLRFLFEAAKAVVKGKTGPSYTTEMHERLRM